MCKHIQFKWATFDKDSKDYTNLFCVNWAYTKISLNSIYEVSRQVENLKGVKIAIGDEPDSVSVHGLKTPIQLVGYTIDNTCNLNSATSNGPSLRWLLEHSSEINTPNTNKLFYVEGMVIEFSPSSYSENTIITILDTEVVDDSMWGRESIYIKKLSKTFEEFLLSYGYIDEDIREEAIRTLIIIQAAKKLEFEDPIEVATHFNDKRLVADLKLKGVLEYVETLCL